MKRTLQILSLFISTLTIGSGVASAHAVVKPSEAGIGSFQTFTLAVPSEKPEATVSVKLLIPAGLSEVTPDVKPGWTMKAVGEEDAVTEIDWTGGSIPASLRDEFSFSAQVPASPTTLTWKAYQTYADGSIVSWDQAPVEGSDDDASDKGPYSTTTVVNDLAPAKTPAGHTADWALGISVIALLLAAYAVTKKSA